MVYIPKDFVPHAASLPHTCVHWGRFVTAAPRRSLGSVSVPMWLAVLSDQLRVVALVGRYPHQLADTKSPAPGPVSLWGPRDAARSRHLVLPGLSAGYPRDRGTLAILYSPVRHWMDCSTPYDLHVLATPPAFRLSQDQTLQLDFVSPARSSRPASAPGEGGVAGTDSFAAGVISKRVWSDAPGVRQPQGRGFGAPAA